MDSLFAASLGPNEIPLSRTNSSERYAADNSQKPSLDYFDLLHFPQIPEKTRAYFAATQQYDLGNTGLDIWPEASTLTSPSCELNLLTPENNDWLTSPTARPSRSLAHPGALTSNDKNAHHDFFYSSPLLAKNIGDCGVLPLGRSPTNKGNSYKPRNMQNTTETFKDDAYWCNQLKHEPPRDNDHCFAPELFSHTDITDDQLRSELLYEQHSVTRPCPCEGPKNRDSSADLAGLKQDSNHGSIVNYPYELKYLNQPFSQLQEVPRTVAPSSFPITAIEEYSLTPQSLDHSNYNTFLTDYGSNSHFDAGSCTEPAQTPQQSLLMEPMALPDESAALHAGQELTACKKSKIDFIIQCRQKGMSYKAIKALGSFTEAESTLRGMVRNTTKDKEERPRKPVWTDRDVTILRDTVYKYLNNNSNCHSLRTRDVASINTRAGERALQKLPWKQIAESMAHRGCHLYGNATVKKKYIEVMGLTPRKQQSSVGRAM